MAHLLPPQELPRDLNLDRLVAQGPLELGGPATLLGVRRAIPAGRRAHRRVRPGPRRRRPDARTGTRGTLDQGPDSGLRSGGCAATHIPRAPDAPPDGRTPQRSRAPGSPAPLGGALLEVSLSCLMQTRLSLLPPGLMGTCTFAAPLVCCEAPRRDVARPLGGAPSHRRGVGGSSALAGRRRLLGCRDRLPGGNGLGAAGRKRLDRLGVMAPADLHAARRSPRGVIARRSRTGCVPARSRRRAAGARSAVAAG